MTYQSTLSLIETEVAIKVVKDYFERFLAQQLHLLRVSAPLFVRSNTGLNDDLNGVEKPISFQMKDSDDELSIVQSLAKWKRHALKRYNIPINQGLYTDMNAIRKDETLDCLHSIYVDQWDWEKIITQEQRTLSTLFDTVKRIYEAMKQTQAEIQKIFPTLESFFPEEIHFISSFDLANRYPTIDPKDREHRICQELGAVFIYQIGALLPNGKPLHDSRAPDYDDWNLNGDILIYYPPLERSIELSSMGIRVDEQSLLSQLEITNQMQRLRFPYHQQVANRTLPYTIGGGIGQSRLCLVMLNKIHICEVQASVWDEDTIAYCEQRNITIL